MYCRKCGKQIDDSSLFCNFCGTPTSGDISASVSSGTGNAGIHSEGIQGIIGKQQTWVTEHLIAVVVATATIFIPVLDFSAAGRGDTYSLWNIWGLIKKLSDYDQGLGAYLEEDIKKLKLFTAVPMVLAVIAAICGAKYLYSVFQKRGNDDKSSTGALTFSFLTIVVVWVYARIMNDGLGEMLDDFLSGLSFTGSVGVSVFSLTGYAIAVAALMLFNLAYVLPQKLGRNSQWNIPSFGSASGGQNTWIRPDWMNSVDNENSSGASRKRCNDCGYAFSGNQNVCPRCKSRSIEGY